MKKFPEKKLFLLSFLFLCLSCSGVVLSFDPDSKLEGVDREDAYYHFALSALYLEGGGPRALESLEEAERIALKSSEVKYRLALIYMVLNMRDEAVAKFAQSIVLDPANSLAYRDLPGQDYDCLATGDFSMRTQTAWK